MFKKRLEGEESDDFFDVLRIIGGLDLRISNPLVFSLSHGDGGEDSVHYLIPKEKYHYLNFLADIGSEYKTPLTRGVIRVLDAEGMLRVERKNARNTQFTDADIAYEYRPVQRLYPTMPDRKSKPAMGWKPIDLTKVNLEAYELIRAAKGRPSKCIFRNGILKNVLSTIEGFETHFRQGRLSVVHDEFDDEGGESDKNYIPWGLRLILRNTNVIKNGEDYHVLCRTDAEQYLIDNRQDVLGGVVRVVACVETGGCFTNRNIINISLYCKDVYDVRALVGDDLRVVEVESLEDLTEKHLLEFKQHPAVIECVEVKKQRGFAGLRPQRVVWPLFVHVTGSGASLLIHPSVSDIIKLPHTVKILQGVRSNESQ